MARVRADPTVAIFVWGDVIEDYLEPIGIDLDTIPLRIRGGSTTSRCATGNSLFLATGPASRATRAYVCRGPVVAPTFPEALLSTAESARRWLALGGESPHSGQPDHRCAIPLYFSEGTHSHVARRGVHCPALPGVRRAAF
jgi:hypothetical protein